MEFFNHIHCKYTGIKGFVGLYNDHVKYQYMIQEKAKKKAEIVFFFEKYGLDATISAFKISKSSIYQWRQILKQNQGRIESLNEKSKSPKNKRTSKVSQRAIDFIKDLRNKYPRLGKDKIKPFLDEFCLKSNLKTIHPSTIGRILKELKNKNLIPKQIKASFYAKTGKVKIHEAKPRKKKLRRKDYQPENPGDLLQLDTIVQFINGLKRYIITAIDLKPDFAFAYAYSCLSSKSASDFFDKLELVAPFKIKRVQTDNGPEFQKLFQETLEKKNIIQFFNYPRHPQQNAKIERFNRTIKEEFVDWHRQTLAYNLDEFNHKLMDWLLWYNTKRPHWSLNLKSPIQYLIENLGFSRMLWTYTAA